MKALMYIFLYYWGKEIFRVFIYILKFIRKLLRNKEYFWVYCEIFFFIVCSFVNLFYMKSYESCIVFLI